MVEIATSLTAALSCSSNIFFFTCERGLKDEKCHKITFSSLTKVSLSLAISASPLFFFSFFSSLASVSVGFFSPALVFLNCREWLFSRWARRLLHSSFLDCKG